MFVTMNCCWCTNLRPQIWDPPTSPSAPEVGASNLDAKDSSARGPRTVARRERMDSVACPEAWWIQVSP